MDQRIIIIRQKPSNRKMRDITPYWIDITPNEPLTENQAKRLAASRGPWALYALMPIDDAKLFAGMPEAERTALIHKGSVAEFAKADRMNPVTTARLKRILKRK